jgi:hypothetical protein
MLEHALSTYALRVVASIVVCLQGDSQTRGEHLLKKTESTLLQQTPLEQPPPFYE